MLVTEPTPSKASVPGISVILAQAIDRESRLVSPCIPLLVIIAKAARETDNQLH
jgi:hypothetical protein